MANREEYEELERIIRAQKPGFTIDKRARPPRPLRGTDMPSQQTPDIDELRRKAEELLGGRARAQGDKEHSPHAEGEADTDDDIRIVNIRPSDPDDSHDQLRKPRKVIISRSKGKIIGEQG